MFCRKDDSPKRRFAEGMFHRSRFAESSISPKGCFAETHFAEAILPKMIKISLL
jgi:hypothetical protein